MGKWAEVPCVCANRIPVDGSDVRPHRRKHRLTKKQQQEVEDWERATENMYACGHRNGMAVELWPGDIIELSQCVMESFDHTWFCFEIFARVGDFRNYQDEFLQVTSAEATIWLHGLTSLQARLTCQIDLENDAFGKALAGVLMSEAAKYGALKRRFKRPEGTFASVGRLRQQVEKLPEPTFEIVQKKIGAALLDAVKLCGASIETGSPILLHW